MGKELTGQLASPPAAPSGNSLPAAPAGESAPRKQTRGDRTPAAAAAGRTPAAAASGNTPAGTAAGKTAEKAQSVGLASVTPPPVPDAPKKKQRNPRQKKQEAPTSFNASQISALIVSVSAIAASRPDMDMFLITENEAMQIATPLANMIAKNENLAGLGEHADAIALVTASFVIMCPRLMLYFDKQKQKKIQAAGGVKLVRTDTQKAAGNGDSRKAARPTPAPSEIDGYGIFAAMPPIAD